MIHGATLVRPGRARAARALEARRDAATRADDASRRVAVGAIFVDIFKI